MSKVDIVSTRLSQFLGAHFRGVEVLEGNKYTIRHGSTRIFVQVTSNGEDSPTIIKLDVRLLGNIRSSAEVEKWVALHADDFRMGHYSLYERETGEIDLYLSHRLLGDYLDDAEVDIAVSWMLASANDVDEELQAQFGGSRFYES